MRHLFARLAAATLTVAAAGAGVVSTSAPAAAAACSGATGVTVVVDHGSLGGGVDQVCSTGGGGRSATSLFTGAGYSLTYVQRQPGFVCRIDGAPASDACVNTPPADAYWGLWWSDGKSGSWSYSSVAAGSLTIPDGGYVGFAWQSGTKAAPGVPATAHPVAPSSSPSPTTQPTTKPTTKPTKPSTTPSTKPSGKPSSAPSSKPTSSPSSQAEAAPTGSATPTSQPTTEPASSAPDQTGTAAATPTEDPTEPGVASASEEAAETAGVTAAEGSQSAEPVAGTGEAAEVDEAGALPGWVVPAVLVLLALGGGAAYLLRRRDRPRP